MKRFTGWAFRLLSEFQHETQLPVFFDADVRAAARAEARFGAGRKLRCFLYITVGTGISSCLVVDETPFAGARGLTGTFASGKGLMAGGGGELLLGTPLEQFASGPALAARYAARCVGFNGAAQEVVALAEADDAIAKLVVATAGQALGAAIAHLVNVLDPEAVVIGGGLGLAPGLYRDSVEETMRQYIWSETHRDIRLVSASLGNDAGIIGAALAGTVRCKLKFMLGPSVLSDSERGISFVGVGLRGRWNLTDDASHGGVAEAPLPCFNSASVSSPEWFRAVDADAQVVPAEAGLGVDLDRRGRTRLNGSVNVAGAIGIVADFY